MVGPPCVLDQPHSSNAVQLFACQVNSLDPTVHLISQRPSFEPPRHYSDHTPLALETFSCHEHFHRLLDRQNWRAIFKPTPQVVPLFVQMLVNAARLRGNLVVLCLNETASCTFFIICPFAATTLFNSKTVLGVRQRVVRRIVIEQLKLGAAPGSRLRIEWTEAVQLLQPAHLDVLGRE